jgi:hypothetical protein
MTIGTALSLISILISMEESGGGLFARFKWKFDLFLWTWKCEKITSDTLYKKCVADFVKEIVRNYKSRIFSENEMENLCDEFTNKYPRACLGKTQLKGMLEEFNKKRKVHFTPGEEAIRIEVKKGLDDVKKAVSDSKEEIMTALSSEQMDGIWNEIIQWLNDSNYTSSLFGKNIVGKCEGLLERAVMLFPNIHSEEKEKYEKFLKQCCLESKSNNSYEIIVNALSNNFEGYVNRYKGLNGLYYSSEYIDILKNCGIKPQISVNIDSIVDSIVACLKKWYRWENENALSEYVEYFFDVLTDKQIVKLAEPYAEIFIDNCRYECNRYNLSVVYKNKEIAKKIVEKNKEIVNGKNDAVYPAVKHFFGERNTSLMTDSEFRSCMWRDFGRKLTFLNIGRDEFFRMSL